MDNKIKKIIVTKILSIVKDKITKTHGKEKADFIFNTLLKK